MIARAQASVPLPWEKGRQQSLRRFAIIPLANLNPAEDLMGNSHQRSSGLGRQREGGYRIPGCYFYGIIIVDLDSVSMRVEEFGIRKVGSRVRSLAAGAITGGPHQTYVAHISRDLQLFQTAPPFYHLYRHHTF